MSLLLCIMAAPFLFTGFLYLSQYQLKQTAYNRLKKERLVCLTFTYIQAEEIDPGSEIKVKGKMLDVTAVNRLPDKVFIYGYYDEEDDELNDKLASVMSQQTDTKAGEHLMAKMWQLFMMPYTSQAYMQLHHFKNSASQLYHSFAESLATISLPVATPPPLCG